MPASAWRPEMDPWRAWRGRWLALRIVAAFEGWWRDRADARHYAAAMAAAVSGLGGESCVALSCPAISGKAKPCEAEHHFFNLVRRSNRGPDHQAEARQTPNVRERQDRPPASACPRRRMKTPPIKSASEPNLRAETHSSFWRLRHNIGKFAGTERRPRNVWPECLLPSGPRIA